MTVFAPHFRALLRIAAIFSAVLIGAGEAAAQASRTGTVRGTVTDVHAALVVGAQVTLTDSNGRSRTALSGPNAAFLFNDITPGTYTLRVEKAGFAPYENTGITVAAGRAVTLEVTIGVTIEETQVVVQDAPTVSTDPEASASAIVLKQADIEALPDNEADLEAALRALAGPAAGPNGGEIFIDGFSGGRLPPRDSIREIRINQNPFSSEFDRLGFGRIEILTKPGTDEFSGEAEFEFEDEIFNSRNPFATNRAPFQVRTIEGNFSGPVVQKRASFFVDAGYEHTDNNSLIKAVVLDPSLVPVPVSFAVVVPETEIEFSPRFDVQLSKNHTLVARYFFESNTSSNAGLGGFDLPSRAYSTEETEHTIRLTETAVLSPAVINETRFQYVRRDRSQTEVDSSPTIRVLDSFTGGGANVGNAFSDERRFELNNTTSVVRGNHIIRFGGRLRHVNLSDASPNNFAGTFTFTTMGQYRDTILNVPGAYPSQFTIAGGDPEAAVGQTDIGLFVLDDWRVRPELTLSFGLRYERQTNISSNLDLAPRFAFAYAPGAGGSGPPKMVLRGGFGIFYERFGETYTLQANRYNGVDQQQFIVTDPTILDPIVFTQSGVSGVPPIDSLTSEPQTTRRVSNELRSPYTFQAAVGIERQLPFKSTLSVSFIHAQTRRVLRSRNINAPINDVRPVPSAGNIYRYESTGRFDQNQLVLNFRTNIADGVSVFANYAFGKAKSDSDGAGSFPANSFDLAAEYGNASIDVRHRFAIGGNFEIPFGISVSPFITYRSGAPFNITTGTDSNEDSVFTERPTFAQLAAGCTTRLISASYCDVAGADPNANIPRNYGRGSDFFVTNLRLSKEFGFGGRRNGDSGRAGSGGGGGSGRSGGINNPFGGGGQGRSDDDDESPYNIEFSVAIRNLFNRTNPGTPVGNLRSPFFGRAVSSAGGFGFGGGGNSSAGNRRIEFEIEFSF